MEIETINLGYIYNKGLKTSKIALDNVSINLNEDKIYGVIGSTGSGKTTFVELLDNLLVPSSGYINIGKYVIKSGSKIISNNEYRKNIGLVFQFPEEQFFETTVEKEISFALKNFNMKDNKKRVLDALSMLGMDESYLNINPFKLSNGEKRKIAIASILVYNPKVLILDEPTVGLDNNNKRMLMRLLRRLCTRYGKKIIIISHDVDMIYNLVDNVIVFKDGKILKQGPKEDVFSNIEFLNKNNIDIPNIVEFENLVLKEKNIKLGSYDDIKDLIKAVYRNV